MFTSGEQVVLVDDKWPKWIAMYDNVPVKNRSYTVREVRLGRPDIQNPTADENNTEVAITLQELKNGPDPHFESGLVELAFRADRFRRLDETREKKEQKAEKPLKQATLF